MVTHHLNWSSCDVIAVLDRLRLDLTRRSPPSPISPQYKLTKVMGGEELEPSSQLLGVITGIFLLRLIINKIKNQFPILKILNRFMN